MPLQCSIDETVARVTHNCVLKAQAHNIVLVTISHNIQCQLCQKKVKDRQLILQSFDQHGYGKYYVANALAMNSHNIPCLVEF